MVRISKFSVSTISVSYTHLTTINTYNYQSIMLQQNNSELSDALQQIAIVEMHHLRLLGQTIFLLGGNPRYMGMQKKQPIYWQGRMVDYNTDLKHLLQRNANAEQYTIDTYQHGCTVIDDPYIDVYKRQVIRASFLTRSMKGVLVSQAFKAFS